MPHRVLIIEDDPAIQGYCKMILEYEGFTVDACGTAAEARGHTRLVEMNRQVLDNLDTIITSLDTPTAESEEAEHAN